MASTSLRFALVAGFGLLLVPLASDAKPTTSTRRPDTTTAPSKTEARSLPPRAPKPLSLAKRLARVNALVTKLGYEKLSKLDDVDALTPRTPELENGAKLEHAAGIGYNGPSPEAPDAVFWLYYKGMTDRSVVGFTWPTEVGKLYAIDCTAKVVDYSAPATANDKVEFDVDEVGRAEEPIAGGHTLHAFIAVAKTTYVRMEFRTDADFSSRKLGWYGCELVPAG